MQECLGAWAIAKKGYDPKHKVPLKTYLGKIVRNTLVKIVEKKERDIRKVEYHTISFHDLNQDVEDKISESDKPADPELKEMLSDFTKKFTPDQQKLCGLLMEGMNINQASKLFSKHRTSVYDDAKIIKSTLKKHGFEKYLNFFRKLSYKSKKRRNK